MMKPSKASYTTIADMEEIRKHTRAVLLSKIGGVPLAEFERDFRAMLGVPFPFRNQGFSDMRSCLESMSDAVRFEYVESSQKVMLFGIADSHSFMSSAAIKAQFTPDKPIRNKNNRRKNNNKKSSGSDDATGKKRQSNYHAKSSRHSPPGQTASLEFKPNMKGLYSICVSNQGSEKQETILELFSQVASPAEYSNSSAHLFFRYSSLEDALNVIARYNGHVMSGSILCVSPAREKLNYFNDFRNNHNPHQPKSRQLDRNKVTASGSSRTSDVDEGHSNKLTDSGLERDKKENDKTTKDNRRHLESKNVVVRQNEVGNSHGDKNSSTRKRSSHGRGGGDAAGADMETQEDWDEDPNPQEILIGSGNSGSGNAGSGNHSLENREDDWDEDPNPQENLTGSGSPDSGNPGSGNPKFVWDPNTSEDTGFDTIDLGNGQVWDKDSSLKTKSSGVGYHGLKLEQDWDEDPRSTAIAGGNVNNNRQTVPGIRNYRSSTNKPVIKSSLPSILDIADKITATKL